MKIVYREIEVSDNFFLAKMIRGVFEEYDAPMFGTVYSDPSTDDLYSLFKTPFSVLWVAVYKETPVGCCGIYPTSGLEKNYSELVKFYLHKDFRGLGIGRELLRRSIQSAKDFAYSHLYLESLPHFSKALRMYENAGFKNINKPLADSGHNSCDIWMVKEL
jgi:putative acetyltransferase